MEQPQTVLQQAFTFLAAILMSRHIQRLPVYIGILFEQQVHGRLEGLLQAAQRRDPTGHRAGR